MHEQWIVKEKISTIYDAGSVLDLEFQVEHKGL